MSISDGDSLSSGHEPENKEKSKVWTADEVELFHILLKKYGTDFHILSNFFPKKTKNQLKVLPAPRRTDTNSTSAENASAIGRKNSNSRPSASFSRRNGASASRKRI
jgi:hypothetical protein